MQDRTKEAQQENTKVGTNKKTAITSQIKDNTKPTDSERPVVKATGALNGCLLVQNLHSTVKYFKTNTNDKIFRRKRLSTGANFVHVYKEIWDKALLKFNKFSMKQVKRTTI